MEASESSMRYDPFDDLLRHQRRAKRGRRNRIFALLAGVLLIAAVIAFAVSDREVGPALTLDAPVEDSGEIALAAAQGAVSGSIFAALEPLRVEPPESPEDRIEGASAEHSAKWSTGKAQTIRGKVEKNESAFLALQKRGVPSGSIHAVLTAMGKEFNFRQSRPGDQWHAEVDSDGIVTRFEYSTSREDIWESIRSSDGSYTTTKKDIPIEVREEVVSGTIESSLWIAFETAGASANLIAQYIDLFAYTIDFNNETQAGDRFTAVFEKVYLDGEFLRDGRILAAKYEGASGTYLGFFHEDGEGGGGFYDQHGDNLKRQFLKSPIPIVRVTSNYGKRFHPVLKRMKMHAGVDFGAPTGTPVLAAADGTVTHAGWKGANGKLVSIRHSSGYVTHYAHLSQIEKGIKKGAKVKQKKQIGRVGTTGRSTGPHLHYGMTKNGKHINPMTVDFARAEPLKGAARKRFVESVVGPMMKRLK